MRVLLSLFFWSTLGGIVGIQASVESTISELTPFTDTFRNSLPKVFLLGEHEDEFQALNLKHSTMLLTACDDDMNVAYGKWMSMLKEMEAYSETENFDLKGIKLWLNVFWAKNGKIKHIAYYLKPNSRNIDIERFTLFLISFLNNYTFPLIHDQEYSHYGSAAFPTLQRREHPKPSGTGNSDGTSKDSVTDGSKKNDR